MKNQGISLISLIITIIVIIILAAIVIFTGLGTPDSANFAHFCQDVDNVYSQVLNKFSDLKVAYATKNDTRSDEQIYIHVATGTDPEMYAAMDATKDTPLAHGTNEDDLAETTTFCQRIIPGTGTGKSGLNLPKVRQSNEAWYIAQNGQVFNATGYVYNVDGQDYTYFTANLKFKGALDVQNATTEATGADKERDRAPEIAQAIIAGQTQIDAWKTAGVN